MARHGVYRGKLLIYLELMSQGKSLEELQAALKIVESHGYRVTKQVVLIQKNLEIEKDLWARVDAVRAARNMLIRECVAEALELWLAQQDQKQLDKKDPPKK